jgi:hypothetical protein
LIEVALGDFRAVWDSGAKDRNRTNTRFGRLRVARLKNRKDVRAAIGNSPSKRR